MRKQRTCEEYLEWLCFKHDNRPFTVLAGDQFGDTGKGAVESALIDFFEAVVRASGGANTGRTVYVKGKDDKRHKLVFHQVPTGWADEKVAIIGDRVLIDLERLINELNEVLSFCERPKQPLYISRKAPVHLKFHRLCEMWIEHIKGKHGVKPTGRGIGPMSAFSCLKLNLLVGHLFEPDLVSRYVKEAYSFMEPIIKAMDNQGLIKKKDYQAKEEIDWLISQGASIKEYVVDTAPIIHDLAEKKKQTLFGLTQGFGIHFSGTYPWSSSTETISAAASYCAGMPMKYFGPSIMVSKLLPTRVGAGPFPTGLWDRQEAENFSLDQPELFSELKKYDRNKRKNFLSRLKEKISSGQAEGQEIAQYFMVLGNELGATTHRGREVGYPDLHLTRCAAKANGADSIVLTRLDLLSDLKIRLPLCLGYRIRGKQVKDLVFPTPAELLDEVETINTSLEMDFRGVLLAGLEQEEELPPDLRKLINSMEKFIKTPLSLSFSPGPKGKIFRY